MAEGIVTLEPNPLTVSRVSRDGVLKGSVVMKNTGEKMVKFQLDFDHEEFSRISPACGELEAGATIPLTLLMEEADPNKDGLSFAVKCATVEPDATQEQIIEIMMHMDDWKTCAVGQIRFATHAEEAMRSVKSAFKKAKKVTVEDAIKRSTSRDLDEEKLMAVQKSITEKEEMKRNLQQKLDTLTESYNEQWKLLQSLRDKPDISSNFAFVALLVLVVAIVKQMLFKK